MTFSTSQITAHRLIPVVVLEQATDALPLAQALSQGGLTVAEITLRTPAALESITIMSALDDFRVGAGTVINAEQVDQVAKAGAQFVVSPGMSAEVVHRCRQLELPVFPGAVTATEIQAALSLGLTTLKYFPAEAAGGIKTLKALAGPFPQVHFIPTGGINEYNLVGYLDLPNVVAIGGSWMVPSKLISAGAFNEICQLTTTAVNIIQSLTGTAT